jgi:hypothetical protein
MRGGRYKSWSPSLCSLHPSIVTSSLIGTNTLTQLGIKTAFYVLQAQLLSLRSASTANITTFCKHSYYHYVLQAQLISLRSAITANISTFCKHS